MSNRRNFLKHSAIGAIGAIVLPKLYNNIIQKENPNSLKGHPMVISTWKHGLPANIAAMEVLHQFKLLKKLQQDQLLYVEKRKI